MTDGVVARGRIRVDARRAVEKLREHQLVDLHHYLHELVRAAVASGAPSVEIDFDADDVTVTWVARPWSLASMPRLLDYVLTEASDDEAQRWRLLAMGVNAALGLGPRFVAVEASDGHEVQRWRFAPEQLEQDAGPKAAAPSPQAPSGWLRVHVARRIGWSVLRRFATRGAPPEVGALLDATRDLDIPLVVAGQSKEPRRQQSAVVSPLRLRGQPGVRRAELHVGLGLRPQVRWLEKGVDLAVEPWPEQSGLPAGPIHDCHLPMAVLVDADALPTNASRSALRADSSLARAVIRAIPTALERAIEALRIAASMPKAVPPRQPLKTEVTQATARELLATMAMLAAMVPDGEHELLTLPLLRGACGEPRPVSSARAASTPVVLYRGERPVDERLAEWMRQVFWLQDSVIDRVFLNVPSVEAGPWIAQAEEGWRKRERFLAHPPAPVAVPGHEGHLLVESVDNRDGRWKGLRGEVALDGAALLAGREQSTVRLFVKERELAVLRVRETPLPMDAALGWERFEPLPSYDGVRANEARDEAIAFVGAVGAKLVLDLWRRSRDRELNAQQHAVMLRAVCAAIAAAPERDGVVIKELATVEAWPTLAGRRASLKELLAERDRRRSLAWVRPGLRGTTANDRLVVVLDEQHHRWLTSIFGPDFELTPYERGVIPTGGEAPHEAHLAQRLGEVLREGIGGEPPAATVSIRRPGIRALMAVASSSRLLLVHAGALLETSREAQLLGGSVAAVEDDTVHPTADWKRIAWSGRTWSFASLERQQLVTLVAALEGDAAAGARCHIADLEAGGYDYLLRSLVAAKDEAENGDDELAQVAARIAGLPLVRMLAPDGSPSRVSLAEVAEVHGDEPIPWLYDVPDFPTLDWHPLVLTRDEQVLVDAWFGQRLSLATFELSERRARVAEEMEKHRLLARPAESVTELRDVAASEPRHVSQEFYDDGDNPAEEVALALVDPDALAITSRVQVGYCGRYFTEVALPEVGGPISARIAFGAGLDPRDWVDGWKQLTPEGERVVRERVGRAAAEFAKHRLSDDRAALTDARMAGLVESLLRSSGPLVRSLRGAIRHRAHFGLAQGAEVEGGAARLGALRRAQGEVYFSLKRFEPWVSGQGALDQPVLWLPADALGSALAGLLRTLDIKTRDVTAALARLHARRTGALADVVPKLPVPAAHPELRIDLQVLGEADDLVGELELARGRSSLSVCDLSGEVREVPWSPFVPLRAMVRWDALPSEANDQRLRVRLEGAGRRFLNLLSKRADQLPALGRTALRGLVGDRMKRRKRLSQALRRAPLFVDTNRRHWSLVALQSEGSPLWVTTEPPPYPARERMILCLDPEELRWFRPLMTRTVRDMTRQLRREVDAVSRRAQAQRQHMVLSSASSERCAFRISLDEQGLRGELGVLPPGVEPAEGEGIAIHVEGRPLCTMALAGLVGVVDVAVEANRFFDGFRRQSDREALASRLRNYADEALRSRLVAPIDVIAEHWVEVESDQGARLCGRFWLSSRFPSRAEVTLWGPGMTQPSGVTLVHLSASNRLDRSLPIGGALWLFPGDGEEDLHHFVTEQSLAAAAAMLANPSASLDSDLYRWAFALLGVELETPPSAAIVGGGRAGPREVVEALRTEERIWFTEGRGHADGAFPDHMPMFMVQRGDDERLIDVLELRATTNLLSEFGGFELESLVPPEPTAFDAEELFAPQPLVVSERVDVPPPAQPGVKSGTEEVASLPDEVAPQPEEVASIPDEALVDPFLSGVTLRMKAWFGDHVAPAPATLDLRGFIEAKLADLPVPQGTVRAVGFSRRGRAVRYDIPTKRVIVNRDHPAVRRWLGDGETPAEPGLERLVAVALSEVNRAIRRVNRSVELEVLLAMLERR